jgi:Protein kinase domain/Putative Ig domain
VHHLGSRYVLEQPIGRGSSGQVWRGSDRSGRPCAIRILRPDLANDHEVVEHLRRMRPLVVGLSSPHLVSVYDVIIVEDEALAIVMELVEGRDLGVELEKNGPLLPAEALRYVAAVLRGLTVLHARGMVHGDVKLANVVLDHSGERMRAKLTDFGLPLLPNHAGNASSGFSSAPDYLAPEYAIGQPVTQHMDIYAVGLLLYQLICGVGPSADGQSTAVLYRHSGKSAERPDGMSIAIWNFIERLTADDPERRPKASEAATAAAGLITLIEPLPEMRAPAAPASPAADRTAILPSHAARPAAAIVANTRRRAVLAVLAVTATIVMGASVAFALSTDEPIGAFTASVESSSSMARPTDSGARITVEPSPTDLAGVEAMVTSAPVSPTSAQQPSSTELGHASSHAAGTETTPPVESPTKAKAEPAASAPLKPATKKRPPTPASQKLHGAPASTAQSLSSTASASEAGTVPTTGSATSTAETTTTTASPASAPKIVTTSLPVGLVGVAYRAPLEAVSSGPVTWTIDGALSAGLILDGATISGTPTSAGSSSFTVKGTNEYGGSSSTAFSIVIAEPVVITTVDLANAVLGEPYSAALAASGVVNPVWSLTNGTLPAGLTLSGSTITGTPTEAGTKSLTVKVVGETGEDTQNVALNVVPPAEVTTAEPPTITIDAAPVQ